jgi:SAM-dependent methyltransferase
VSPEVDINAINTEGWNRRVREGDVWTLPVTREQIARARRGEWSVFLTNTKPVPREWFGDLAGARVLALASGGGQQGPILAAAGARVTVFDASPAQLATDARVAEREGLELRCEEGFMHDLLRFADESFDLVFHPVSNCFAPEILPVWREVFRVLRPGGALIAGFMNPASYIFDSLAEDRGEVVVRFPLPYSDAGSLTPEELALVREEYHTLEFSHTLEEQIGGQLAAGFQLTAMYEDAQPQRPVARYLPDTIATRAVKP